MARERERERERERASTSSRRYVALFEIGCVVSEIAVGRVIIIIIILFLGFLKKPNWR